MKVNIIFLIIQIAICSKGYCQLTYEKHVQSFLPGSKSSHIKFSDVIQKVNPMTEDEAIRFVYGGDTSKLTCITEIYNTMTEKKVGETKEILLPDKCVSFDMGEFYLIGYSSYECQPKAPIVKLLTLSTINKKYRMIDQLVVYKERNDMQEIIGLFNSHTNTIFLIGFIKNQSNIQSSLFTIDRSTLRFKLLKEVDNVKGDYRNLENTLNNLGWRDEFIRFH